MYAYIAKGFTSGHIIARNILRNIIGLPGFALDCFFALFYAPDYMSYWGPETDSVIFPDGTKTHSFCYGIFGMWGDFLGYAVGGIGGALIGMALYIPDLFLQGFIALHNKVSKSISNFADFIAKTTFFRNLGADMEPGKPKGYLERAWSLGVFGGTLVGLIPFAATKGVEFVFPFLSLSRIVLGFSAFLGGMLGVALGLVIALPIHLLQGFTDFLSRFRSAVKSGIALLYACGHEHISVDGDECCEPGTLHDQDFVDQVKAYEKSTWAKLIFGPLSGEEETVTTRSEPANGRHYRSVIVDTSNPPDYSPSEHHYHYPRQ